MFSHVATYREEIQELQEENRCLKQQLLEAKEGEDKQKLNLGHICMWSLKAMIPLSLPQIYTCICIISVTLWMLYL